MKVSILGCQTGLKCTTQAGGGTARLADKRKSSENRPPEGGPLTNPIAEKYTTPSSDFAQAEAQVEANSAALRKELGVRDLVLTQILFIVGLAWIGIAGKLGPSHVVFWLLAILFFYLPSAAVVIYLNRLMPLEGGLYQWASSASTK